MGDSAVAGAASMWLVSGLFLLLGLLLIVLCLCALYVIGLERLHSREGIARDGLRPGSRAPTWSEHDTDGHLWSIPNARGALLLFADHSMRHCPAALTQIDLLRAERPDIDVVMIPKGNQTVAEHVVRAMDSDIPVLTARPDLYDAYAVRVLPFAVFVSYDGRVAQNGLASLPENVLSIWRLGLLRPFGEVGTAGEQRRDAWAMT